MTVEEIFSKISAHMIEGMMFHEQMCNYYDFLGLHGYKRCHEYHYLCETIEHRKLERFYINRYNKLIPDSDIDSSSVIPSGWGRYTRQEVDKSTKRGAVETGVTKWLEWEKETRKLYTDMYIELEDMGEVSAAKLLCELVCKADKEIKYAERKKLDLEAVDYDLTYICMKQHKMHKKYKCKVKDMVAEL